MARFIDEAGERAFQGAVEAIENASAAEVVVAVRPHAQEWLVPSIGLGLVAAVCALAYGLWGDRAFALWEIFGLPLVAGTAVALLAHTGPIYRLLLPARLRDAYVAQAGRATFVERNVHATRERTGVLVYISLVERRVLLVGDIAFERALGDALLDRWEQELSALVKRGGVAVAQALGKHAEAIGRHLPHPADDSNELPDAVVTTLPRARRRRPA